MAELYADLPAQASGARRTGVYYDRRTAGSLQEWLVKVAASPVVYVGNLNFSTTEDELHELFSQAGLVRRVVMGLNKHSREPCGFAFVEFFHSYEAQNSIILLNGASCDGRVVRVDADSGESIEDDRKFGRGFTGRQWRDEYREEYDPGRGGEGRKKRSRSEAEEAAFAAAAARDQPFFAAGAPAPPPVFAPPVAAPGPFCMVPPPPPPAAGPSTAAAAAAALDAAVAEEAATYMWQRNVRARRHHNNTATAVGQGVPAPIAAGLAPPSYSVFSPPQHPAPYAPPPAANMYLHGSYLELVQQAQQQAPHQIDPFGTTGSAAATFMRSRGGRNAGRHHRGGGGRN